MSEAFVVIDLETTDREPENAHVVEYAAIVIKPPWFGEGGEHFQDREDVRFCAQKELERPAAERAKARADHAAATVDDEAPF